MKVFIGCSKVKLEDRMPHPERELYCSSIFRKSLRYAKTLTDEKNIFVLSAKYGVVRLDQQITAYNQTLIRMSRTDRARWSEMVKSQFPRYRIYPSDSVVFLAGSAYFENLTDYFHEVRIPMDGLSPAYREKWLADVLRVKE